MIIFKNSGLIEIRGIRSFGVNAKLNESWTCSVKVLSEAAVVAPAGSVRNSRRTIHEARHGTR